ncbi:MAG: hypothetical protein QQN41_12465 [Nitrosopumilus sp.]
MTDIVKASRAVAVVLKALRKDKKSLAIWLMEMTYQCDKEEATDFVEVVEDVWHC